jgi:hypothetical protein
MQMNYGQIKTDVIVIAEYRYKDNIGSGEFSDREFVRMVYSEMNSLFWELVKSHASYHIGVSVKKSIKVSSLPIRHKKLSN